MNVPNGSGPIVDVWLHILANVDCLPTYWRVCATCKSLRPIWFSFRDVAQCLLNSYREKTDPPSTDTEAPTPIQVVPPHNFAFLLSQQSVKTQAPVKIVSPRPTFAFEEFARRAPWPQGPGFENDLAAHIRAIPGCDVTKSAVHHLADNRMGPIIKGMLEDGLDIGDALYMRLKTDVDKGGLEGEATRIFGGFWDFPEETMRFFAYVIPPKTTDPSLLRGAVGHCLMKAVWENRTDILECRLRMEQSEGTVSNPSLVVFIGKNPDWIHVDKNDKWLARSDENLMEIAARKANVDTVRWLLEHGARPDVTSVCSAAAKNRTDVLSLFLAFGAKIKERRSFHRGNAFKEACRSRSFEAAQWLLNNGMNADDDIDEAMRALLYGDEPPSLEFVQLLIDHGADVNAIHPDLSTESALIVREDHFNPIYLAARYGEPGEAICHMLIAAGADVNRMYYDDRRNYWVPLSIALREGNLSATKMLLKLGADPGLIGPFFTDHARQRMKGKKQGGYRRLGDMDSVKNVMRKREYVEIFILLRQAAGGASTEKSTAYWEGFEPEASREKTTAYWEGY